MNDSLQSSNAELCAQALEAGSSTTLHHFTTRLNANEILRDGWIRPGYACLNYRVAEYHWGTGYWREPSECDTAAERDPRIVYLTRSFDPASTGRGPCAQVRFDLLLPDAVPWTRWLESQADHPGFDAEWIKHDNERFGVDQWYVSAAPVSLRRSCVGFVLLGCPCDDRLGVTPRLPSARPGVAMAFAEHMLDVELMMDFEQMSEAA